jgi:hypothetical protein
MNVLTDPLATPSPNVVSTPTFERHGDEYSMAWSFPAVSMTLTAIREGRDGMRGELVVSHRGLEIHWGHLALSSTSARETLVRKLQAVREDVPWRLMVERMCRTTAQAVRQGEPLVMLTGRSVSATRELLPRMFYEGEPTAIIGDGDTGKSLFAVTVAAAISVMATLESPSSRSPSLLLSIPAWRYRVT